MTVERSRGTAVGISLIRYTRYIRYSRGHLAHQGHRV